MLETPHEENLLHGLALALCDVQQLLVLVERRVGAAQAGVTSAVDTLGSAVSDELGRWVIWVEFDLIDRRDDLRDRELTNAFPQSLPRFSSSGG